MGRVIFSGKVRKKRSSEVMKHILPGLESFAYIFVADIKSGFSYFNAVDSESYRFFK